MTKQISFDFAVIEEYEIVYKKISSILQNSDLNKTKLAFYCEITRQRVERIKKGAAMTIEEVKSINRYLNSLS